MPSKILSARGMAAFLALVTALLLAGQAIADDPFEFELEKPNDNCKLQLADNSLTVSLHSQSGIGKGTLKRLGKEWPKGITIRLYLSGLEMFHATAGDVTLAASVPSTEPAKRYASRLVGNHEVSLKLTDALWFDVELLDKQGKPAEKIPLDDGHFKITLPAALWKDNPAEIQLEWIDFYRG